MKKIVLLNIVAALAISTTLLPGCGASKEAASTPAADNTLTEKEKKEGWVLLFNGKDLKGWHSWKRDTVAANWIVKDGQIQYNRDQDRAGDDLVTDGIYENYELSLQWRISKGGNSGIIFNIQEDPKYGATWQTGAEMQVLDNIDAQDKNPETHLAGCLYDMLGGASVSKPVTPGEWNQVKIIQNKGQLTFWLNGIKTVDVKVGSPEWDAAIAKSKFKGRSFSDFMKVLKGKIAVQKHPGSSGWKNIKIREIKG